MILDLLMVALLIYSGVESGESAIIPVIVDNCCCLLCCSDRREGVFGSSGRTQGTKLRRALFG